MSITLGEALKSIGNFIFGIKPNNHENVDDKENAICRKCGEHLGLYEQFTNDFLTIIVYQCNECGSFRELQYNANNELMKEINIYEKFPATNTFYLEILSKLQYNQFSLLRLWLINGHLCFPVLMRSDVSSNVTLLFVKVGTNLTHDNIHGFLVNENNIVSEAIISKDNSFSYFYNPYLSKLPHPDLDVKANTTERADGIDYASNIRFQHKIQRIQNRNVHKLRIIEDFPIQNYGIEVYVKFITHDNVDDNLPISEIIKKIDLENIVLGRRSVNTDIDYSIQTSHVAKICPSYNDKNSVSPEQREKLIEDIMYFFQYELNIYII